MGNTIATPSKIDFYRNFIIKIEIYPYYHDKNNLKINSDLSIMISNNLTNFKKFIINIIKNSFLDLKHTSYINIDNVFLEFYKNGSDFMNIQTIIKLESLDNETTINEDKIKMALVYGIHLSQIFEIERNIFLRLLEKKIRSIEIVQVE